MRWARVAGRARHRLSSTAELEVGNEDRPARAGQLSGYAPVSEAPESPVLELAGVEKKYGDTHALHSLDLTFARGRTTVLLGPSGCGKSTLLRLIIGLVPLDAGTIRFDGVDITRDTVIDARRRMGYVIQEGGLFPHLTARANVSLMATYLGWAPERIDARVEELAELTHMGSELLDRFPGELSGGQRQRVSLMRALALDPEVLLLDEPLGALDPMIRADLQHDLREIFRSLGKTVVLVTHDIGEAGHFADTISMMRDGRVVQQGGLKELVNAPADEFVTRFINAQRSPLHTDHGGVE